MKNNKKIMKDKYMREMDRINKIIESDIYIYPTTHIDISFFGTPIYFK